MQAALLRHASNNGSNRGAGASPRLCIFVLVEAVRVDNKPTSACNNASNDSLLSVAESKSAAQRRETVLATLVAISVSLLLLSSGAEGPIKARSRVLATHL